jgi:hypothetical protein
MTMELDSIFKTDYMPWNIHDIVSSILSLYDTTAYPLPANEGDFVQSESYSAESSSRIQERNNRVAKKELFYAPKRHFTVSQ